MLNNSIIEKMRVLETFSILYRSLAYPSQEWLEVIQNNPKEALKFFLSYAYSGRAGAPKSFLITAIHCIENCIPNSSYHWNQNILNCVEGEFSNYNPKPNPSLNPLFTFRSKQSAIMIFNFNEILNNLKESNVRVAYNSLKKITGVGPKIAAFFLRDITDLFKINIENWKEEKFYYLQPIDKWIRMIASLLRLQINSNEIPQNMEAGEGLYDKCYIVGICRTCLTNNINPLRFNQGAWFFASMICGTKKVLEDMLQNFTPNSILKRALSFKIIYPHSNWKEFEEYFNSQFG